MNVHLLIIGVLLGIPIGAGIISAMNISSFEDGYRRAIFEMFSKNRGKIASYPVDDDVFIRMLKYSIDEKMANEVKKEDGDSVEDISDD